MSNDFVVQNDDADSQIQLSGRTDVPTTAIAPTEVAAPVMPAYLIENRDFWAERVQNILGPHLAKKSVNRVVNAIERRENGLFNQTLDLVYNADFGTYQCFSDDLFLEQKHQKRVVDALPCGWPNFQKRFQYFTNSLSLCSSIDGQHTGPAPMLRIVNAGKVILTFEWDVGAVAFLDQQIRWSIAGSDKKSTLDGLYAKLCSYWDFRWLEAVWSGHKSLHIHILVDSRHLYPTRFAGDYPLPSGWIDDIPDRLFRNGVMASSALLTPLVQQHFELDVKPDELLHQPDRFRRTPWGIRKLPDGNIFGVAPGTRVPQVVLYSKGRSYARVGENWLLSPAEFFAVERQTRRRAVTPDASSRSALAPEMAAGFISGLSAICEKLFGPKQIAPFPVAVEKGPNGWRIRFRNNLEDRTPGSVMEGHHFTILIGSADPTIKGRRYEFPMSADQLVERYVETGTLRTRFPTCAPHWTEVQFRNGLDWFNSDNPEEFDALDNPNSPWGLNTSRPQRQSRIATVPEWLIRGNCERAAESDRALIESMPGAGKTDAIIKAMLDAEFDPDRRGFQAVASSSYGQAINKIGEFNSKFADAGKRAVLLRAFDDVYKEVCPRDRLAIEDAAALGYGTVMEAVYATRPDIAELLDGHRREMQEGLGFDQDGDLNYARRDDILIFCTHSLIHRWPWHGGSKLWIHPLFDQWRSAKLAGDVDRLRQIQRAVDFDLRLSWVLYDEISMADIIVHHPREQVEHVQEFIAGPDRPGDLSATELYSAWQAYKTSRPANISFETMREINYVAYREDDLLTVDPVREPFGVNNKAAGLYTGMAGQQHYAKNRDWWDHLACRLTVTTTEHKPRWALEQVGRRQRVQNERRLQTAQNQGKPERLKPVWNTFAYDPAGYVPAEFMQAQIYLDARARAPRNDDPSRPSVETIRQEIRSMYPDACIVSNIIDDDRTITPIKARGSNDFIGQKIFYLIMFLARDRYRDLLIENEVHEWDCAVQLDYLDEFDQIAGRTLGFRYRPGSQFITIISPRLWKQIGQTLRLESRFHPRLVTQRPW